MVCAHRSDVWNAFSKIRQDALEVPYVQCNFCQRVMSYKQYTGTGSLRRHAATHHFQIGSLGLARMGCGGGAAGGAMFAPGIGLAAGLMGPEVGEGAAALGDKSYGSDSGQLEIPAICVEQEVDARNDDDKRDPSNPLLLSLPLSGEHPTLLFHYSLSGSALLFLTVLILYSFM